ncbi:hypothetical protein DIE18_02290 [Burkholderia sp. Bp9125]|nr:hypothetical protein DIE18_02290 [Burkholderia sp. Bp9125]
MLRHAGAAPGRVACRQEFSSFRARRKSIGLNEFRQYRNHFVAGGSNIELCRQAVSRGHMVERAASVLTGGSPWFSVTPAGIEYVGDT